MGKVFLKKFEAQKQREREERKSQMLEDGNDVKDNKVLHENSNKTSENTAHSSLEDLNDEKKENEWVEIKNSPFEKTTLKPDEQVDSSTIEEDISENPQLGGDQRNMTGCKKIKKKYTEYEDISDNDENYDYEQNKVASGIKLSKKNKSISNDYQFDSDDKYSNKTMMPKYPSRENNSDSDASYDYSLLNK